MNTPNAAAPNNCPHLDLILPLYLIDILFTTKLASYGDLVVITPAGLFRFQYSDIILVVLCTSPQAPLYLSPPYISLTHQVLPSP